MRAALGHWALTGALLGLALTSCGGVQRPSLPPGACSPADPGDDSRPWARRQYGMHLPAIAPRRGAARPRVVIQEFSDFECPYCAAARPTMERILEEYGACVQLVWRNRPLPYHRHSAMAARAAMEVFRQGGDEAFWRYHDVLFDHQDALGRADLEAYAESLGDLDVDAFRAGLDSGAHDALLERDESTLSRTGLTVGAPAFFVNGELVHGARSFGRFRLAVEEALADALEEAGER